MCPHKEEMISLCERGATSNPKRTNEVVDSHFHRNAQLCADTVRSADEDRVFVPGGLQVEHAAESTDLCIRTRATCCADVRLDCLHQRIAGINRDTCLGIGQALRGLGLGGQRPANISVRIYAQSYRAWRTYLWAMSRRKTLPSNDTLATPAYAASKASRSVGA